MKYASARAEAYASREQETNTQEIQFPLAAWQSTGPTPAGLGAERVCVVPVPSALGTVRRRATECPAEEPVQMEASCQASSQLTPLTKGLHHSTPSMQAWVKLKKTEPQKLWSPAERGFFCCLPQADPKQAQTSATEQ